LSAHLIAEIDITETPAEMALRRMAQRVAASTAAPEKAKSVSGSAKKA
jgi:hypothetical protein